MDKRRRVKILKRKLKKLRRRGGKLRAEANELYNEALQYADTLDGFERYRLESIAEGEVQQWNIHQTAMDILDLWEEQYKQEQRASSATILGTIFGAGVVFAIRCFL